MHLKPLPPPPSAPSPQRSARIAAVGTGVMAAPFLFLGLFFLDRPAHTELTCAPDGGACTLVRRGWMTQAEPVAFSPSLLATARVDRDVRGSTTRRTLYRPVFELAGAKQPLTYRWVEGGEAARELVARLHAHASAPRAPLTFEDDARRATAGVGGSFLGAGLGVLGLAAFFAHRGWRRQP